MCAAQIDPSPDPFDRAIRYGLASSDAVVLLDPDGIPRWANAAAHALHGVSSLSELGALPGEYMDRLCALCPSSLKADPDGPGLQTARPARDQAPRQPQDMRADCHVRTTVLRAAERVVGHAITISVRAVPVAGAQAAGAGAGQAFPDGIGPAAALLQCREPIIANVDGAPASGAGTGRAGGGHASSSCLPAILVNHPDAICLPAACSPAAGSGRAVPEDGQTKWPVMLEADRLVAPGRSDTHAGAATPARSLFGWEAATPAWLCDMIPAPIFVLDAERRVVAASDALLDLLGYASADFFGHHIVEFLAGSSIRFFRDVFWPGLADCGLAEDRACELLTSRGGTLRVRLAGRPVLDGQTIRCVTCVIENLTEHHFSEAKFTALFTLSPVPMLVRRLEDGRILHTNPALLSLTGHAPDTLTGRPMDELAIFEPSAARQRFERELRAGRPLRGAAMRLKAADGALLDVQATATAVQVSSQSCALVILQDAASGRFDEQQMFRAIEAVMSDTSWFSRSVVEKLASVRVPGTPRVKAGELDDLTKREREVLAMISHGWGDAEIASRLSLTRSTVRNHVAALYSKIDVHSRSSAIIWARERALNVIHPAAELRQMPPCRGVVAHPRAERVRTTP